MVGNAHNRRYALAGLAAVFCALALLYFFPPDRYGFYPACPFHQATGLLCPGCGATRALAALLHGHLGEALRLNALVVVLLPVALAYALAAYRRRDWPQVPGAWAVSLAGVALVFGVARNLVG